MDAIIPFGAEMAISAVSFLILFVLMWRFALPPITAMLEERAARIRESLERAEATKVEAERLLEDYKAQLAEARGESAKIVEQARRIAETMKDEIVAKANEEAAGVVAKAHEAMEAEKKAALVDLQAEVASLSVAVAGKLIGEKLNAEDHAKLIDKFVAEVGSLNGN
jgi:F-type H+-transporting ATPase subunit b